MSRKSYQQLYLENRTHLTPRGCEWAHKSFVTNLLKSSIRHTRIVPDTDLVSPTHNRSLPNIKIYIYGGLHNVKI